MSQFYYDGEMEYLPEDQLTVFDESGSDPEDSDNEDDNNDENNSREESGRGRRSSLGRTTRSSRRDADMTPITPPNLRRTTRARSAIYPPTSSTIDNRRGTGRATASRDTRTTRNTRATQQATTPITNGEGRLTRGGALKQQQASFSCTSFTPRSIAQFANGSIGFQRIAEAWRRYYQLSDEIEEAKKYLERITKKNQKEQNDIEKEITAYSKNEAFDFKTNIIHIVEFLGQIYQCTDESPTERDRLIRQLASQLQFDPEIYSTLTRIFPNLENTGQPLRFNLDLFIAFINQSYPTFL